MPCDSSTEYSERSDDELLHLASQRTSLTEVAAAALDTELRRRNLSEADKVQHQRFVKRQEHGEFKRRRKKTFSTFKDRARWIDGLYALLAMVLISFAYLELPKRYHMAPDWQEAAANMMIASVVIIAVTRTIFWRRFMFWISLVISSALHLMLVHIWARRTSDLSRSGVKRPVFSGFIVCGGFRIFLVPTTELLWERCKR